MGKAREDKLSDKGWTAVAQWLAAQKPDAVLVKVDLTGRGPDYVFRDAGIQVTRTGKGKLTEVIDDLHFSPVNA